MAMVGGGALLLVVVVVVAVMATKKGGGGGRHRGKGPWKKVDCSACPADVDPAWQACGFPNRCKAMCAPGDRAAKKAAFQCHHKGAPGRGRA